MIRPRLKESAQIIQFPGKKKAAPVTQSKRPESEEADNGEHFEKWHKSMITPKEGRVVSHGSAYSSYEDHAEDHGVEPMSFDKFHSKMKDKGYVSKKHMGQQGFVGITVKPEQGAIDEEVHPRIKGVLEKLPPDKIIHGIRQVTAAIKARGEDPGVTGKTMFPIKGSSRAVFHVKKPAKINLDGKKAEVPLTVKMAFRGSQDNKKDKHLTGQLQNRAESSDNTRQFYMMHKVGRKFETNPEGIVPTVHSKGKNNKHLVVDRVDPVGPHNYDKFREATKHETTPNGFSVEQFIRAVTVSGHIHRNHPVVKKFRNFKDVTGIGDFHDGNIGLWKHPHTGQHHVVLLDAGFDDESKKRYNRSNTQEVSGKNDRERSRKIAQKTLMKMRLKYRRPGEKHEPGVDAWNIKDKKKKFQPIGQTALANKAIRAARRAGQQELFSKK